MGGGGASGTVVFPAYVENLHRDWMNNTGLDAVPVSVAGVMSIALGPGGNPYATAIYSDPIFSFNQSTNDFAAFATLVDGINAAGNWGDFVTAVSAKMTAGNPLRELTHQTMYAAAAAKGEERYAQLLLSKGQSGVSEVANWDSFIQAVVTRSNGGDIVNINPELLVAGVQNYGLETVLNGLSVATTGIDEIGDWGSIYDTAIERVTGNGLITDVNVNAIVTSSLTSANATVAAAITAAANAVQSIDIQNLIDAYTTTLAITKGRTLRSFNASMAGGAAVHTSAFVIGQALIEVQFAADINKYTGEIKLETFRSALSLYNGLVGNLASLAVQASSSSSQLRAGMLTSSIQGMIELLSTRVQFEQALTGLFANTTSTHANLLAGVAGQNKQSREQYISQGVESLNSMQQVRTQYEQALMQLRAQLFGENMTAEFRSAATNKQSHDNFVSQSVADISARQALKMQSQNQIVSGRLEKNRLDYVARSEYTANEADMNAKQALWDLGIFEKGINLLAGPSGMAAPLPNAPSKAQSAIGGAMGGAAAGAAFGPVGAGIGAAVGGVLGILS